MVGMIRSTSLEVVGEVLVDRDPAARQAQPVGFVGERVDLRPVPLETEGMEVLAHHAHRVLELGLEPRRGVREALLSRAEAIVGGDERLGQAAGDPAVRFPYLATQDDQVLRRKRAGLEKVLLDRKSTRLNSSHRCNSYAVFCLKKKKHFQT